MESLRGPTATALTLITLLAGCSDAAGIVGEQGTRPEADGRVVDTGQTDCYDHLNSTPCPAPGQSYFGQDAQHEGSPPRYLRNGDGTVTDLNSGLMWAQSPDTNGDGKIDAADKLAFHEAGIAASQLTLAEHTDWRLPTIKELYSLMDFRGVDPSGYQGTSTSDLVPFIDTGTFAFGYGDPQAGERIIDAQFATSTRYVGTTMGGAATMFGVNFADGRIKGYPTDPMPGQAKGKGFYVLFVRGEVGYGENLLQDNGDGTLTDVSTGLMWALDDSGVGMDWQTALAWAQERNAESYLGYADWRLPDVKELQSLVDYGRAPDVTGTPAIDPLFHTTAITNEAGQKDYPAFWSSTTHVNLSATPGGSGAYVCFGRCMGYWLGEWTDVHGAGAQRSDPKAGDPSAWPNGRGPQGDAIRIDNFVRLVRGGGGQ